MYFDFGVLTYFSYRIQERLDRCGDNVCVGAETVVHFAFVGDLYVYFTQVVASPGDGLYQVFFQMYPSFGDAFYSIDGCIDRAVTAGCFGENISPEADLHSCCRYGSRAAYNLQPHQFYVAVFARSFTTGKYFQVAGGNVFFLIG